MGRKEKAFKTGRLTVPAAERVLGRRYDILNHGFVRLVDYMGGDQSIVDAARVSYQMGTQRVSSDTGLIRYLMRHRHTTPFEMVEAKFHAKMPIFVARQWIRHRTANVNEESARYSKLANEFYVPEPEDLGVQARGNRQGRDEAIGPEEATVVLGLLKAEAERAYESYEFLLNEDPENKGQPRDPDRSMLARELARMNLSLNFYTSWYWKIDLHNLFHFLGLRKDSHAQKEIRVYADRMGEMAKAIAPIAYKAFEDYRFGAMQLSAPEIQAMKSINEGKDPKRVIAQVIKNGRERDEFLSKLERLSL